MKSLTPSQTDEIVATLDRCDDKAIRHAIGVARDPDAALELAHRLRDDFVAFQSGQQEEQFRSVALCIVLSEAHALGVIPILLDVATTECDCFAEVAAQYALRRMGPPAFDAATRLI